MKMTLVEKEKAFKPFKIEISFDTQEEVDEYLDTVQDAVDASNICERDAFAYPINQLTQAIKFRNI